MVVKYVDKEVLDKIKQAILVEVRANFCATKTECWKNIKESVDSVLAEIDSTPLYTVQCDESNNPDLGSQVINVTVTFRDFSMGRVGD